MNLRDSSIPSTVTDLGTTVVELLPVELSVDRVTDVIDDLPLPDLDAVADVAVEIGRSGSRRIVRVARTAGRHPYRTTLVLSSLLAVVVALAIVKRRRSNESPQLTMAEAA
jgi:hypothetical protein